MLRIARVLAFTQLAEAKARMEAGAHVGKIVLRIDSNAASDFNGAPIS